MRNAYSGLAKSLARHPGAIVFSSLATKMYHCPARQATLNTGLPRVLKNSQFTCITFKAIKSFKYIKWYKKSLNYNFKRSYSWGQKDKNRDTAAHFKVKHCLWHFHFILPIMPDKAAYMSAVLLCVQPLPEKPLYLLLKRHLVAESEFAFPVCLMFRSMRIL